MLTRLKNFLIKNYRLILLSIFFIALHFIIRGVIVYYFPEIVFEHQSGGLIFNIVINEMIVILHSAILLSICVLLYFVWQNPIYLFLFAFGVSNLIERIFYGYVVDYIWLWRGVYNISDIGLIFVCLWVVKKSLSKV